MIRGRYVIVTPVRNEVERIGRTIASVAGQSISPLEWVIVSDGSDDGTDDVVRAAQAENEWIRLVSLPARNANSFAAVVRNTELGVQSLKCSHYEFLCLLDSDIELPPDYFARLLAAFDDDATLGLAGGVVVDPGERRDAVPRNKQDVPGAVQCFRRQCFESLGGLIPLPEGGWDTLSCAMARKAGYRTALQTDLVVDHLKPRNVSQGGILSRKWQLGARDYAVGYGAVFELGKCLIRAGERPVLFAAAARWAGFCDGWLRRRTRLVPDDVVAFVQREQRDRLRAALGLPRRRAAPVVSGTGTPAGAVTETQSGGVS